MSEDPIFLLTDELTDQGAAVVKSLFPNATDEECGAAAAGAFMAILNAAEGGKVIFAYTENGPFFRFLTKSDRSRN